METRHTDESGIVVHNVKAYNVTLKKDVNVWGHFDTNDGRLTHVGPWYKSKAELLADHENYLRGGGWIV